ncbi:MAG: hypothetical protein IKL68_02170 [Clostridia bacterium]|nr:hypothetical protein [Clostridia bacterium]
MATLIKRAYTGFRGVDFANDASLVNLSRSPDALNVWKNYADTQGSCIETRPGYVKIGDFGDNINGIYFYNNQAFIHSGTNLYLWTNFPTYPEEKTLLKSDMNNKRSSFAIFDDKLYILDGKNYLVYYDKTLKKVSEDNPIIPTTAISRAPLGGGEQYQDINVLQPLRKNTFVGDGTSVDYYLDAQNISEVTEVKVNDDVVTEYEVDVVTGKVTFTIAPIKPDLAGIDNVEITFKKEIEGYTDRIDKCTKVVSFDRRLFFTGNPDYPNAVFHSMINTPSYISDLSYYQDGTDESEIKAMVVGNNMLWVFKEPNQQNETIFYHTSTLDAEGKVYPSYQGNVSTGCYSDAINYKDDIVFLSRNGLEGISSNDINSKQLLSHRSSLVDNKLTNENNFNHAMMAEWNGYLLVLANHRIYLADMRQMFAGTLGYEYEWYLWDLSDDEISYIKEYKGNLYIGSEKGLIFCFQGTNDDGKVINSYWTTPMDNFGYGNTYKTTNKRGGIAKIKTIPNGIIKVSEKTNKKETTKEIAKHSATGFDFENIDFENFSFETQNNSYIVYKIKEKKFVEISLKFYSDEIDKPFGLYSAILESFIGGYVKK